MRLLAPTRVHKCWYCWSDCDMYMGYGPTVKIAILDMWYQRDRHLKGMAAEEEKKNRRRL